MLLEFILEHGVRLDTGISTGFPDKFSRSQVQKLIRSGNVRVNGVAVFKPSHKGSIDEKVEILYELPRGFDLTPKSDADVPLIFQDSYFAIVHKPAGMTVHPGAGTKDDTLVHVLLAQMESLSDGTDESRPGIVHRLDRETEGLMIIAKDNHTHFELAKLFSERKIIKEYYAVVWGSTPDFQKIEGYIGRHPVDRKKMLFETIRLNDTYKEASMEYRTLNRNEYFSLLEIRLFTGRTHQIRASLSRLEHPVLGDDVYSRFQRRLDKTKLTLGEKEKITEGGLFLVAFRVSFQHPVTNEHLDFKLPMPDRFVNLFSS